MVTRRLAIFALSLTIGFGASVARAETLGSALASAYETSGLLAQNRALLRAADEDVARSVAALMPVLSWSANIKATVLGDPPPRVDQVSWESYAAITAQMTLYDFGAGDLAVKAARETVLGTREQLRGIEQQVLLRAVQAYENVRRETAFLDLRRSALRVIEEEARAAKDRFDVGEITRTDVALSEARLAAAKSQLAAAEGALARASEEYAAVVGHRPGRLDPAPAAPLPASEAAARQIAMHSHPSLAEAQHKVSAAELNLERAELSLRPTVNGSAQVGVDGDGNTAGQFSVTIGGPLYSGGAIEASIRQVAAYRDASRSGLHLASGSVSQGIGNAFANLSVARAGRLAFEQQIAASSVAYDGIREEAELGARTSLEVLNAEQSLLDARASLLSAQSDEVIASYVVLSAMGLLTAEHLKLAVQLYDPAAYYDLVKDAPSTTSPQGAALDRVLQAIGGN